MTRRVLVVDDEELVRKLVRETLMLRGYEAAMACDGQQALERMGEDHYDLVITDVVMPVMAGFELMRRLKKGWPGVKVVVLTGYSREHDISDFLLHGADEFLAKPFRVDELVSTVDRLLN